MVHLAYEIIRVEASRPLADLLRRLRQEPARNGAVGVERHTEFPEQREEQRLLLARHSGVVALVDGGEDVGVLFAVVVDSLHSVSLKVGETEAREGAGFVDFLDAREPVGEGDAGVRGVDVEDVD